MRSPHQMFEKAKRLKLRIFLETKDIIESYLNSSLWSISSKISGGIDSIVNLGLGGNSSVFWLLNQGMNRPYKASSTAPRSDGGYLVC